MVESIEPAETTMPSGWAALPMNRGELQFPQEERVRVFPESVVLSNDFMRSAPVTMRTCYYGVSADSRWAVMRTYLLPVDAVSHECRAGDFATVFAMAHGSHLRRTSDFILDLIAEATAFDKLV